MVGTTLLVVIGCILGGLSLSQIWGLFGEANQLLAGIALMAVWGDWFQLFFAAAMAILALVLVAEGIQTFKKQAAMKKKAA